VTDHGDGGTDSDRRVRFDDAPDGGIAWRTTDATIDYECPGFDVRRDDVRLPDDREAAYHSVVEADTVVILPFTPDGDVVVIEEWRQAVGRVARGLPAGGIEPGESPTAAAERELAEEAGYEAGTLTPFARFEPANGLLDAEHRYVLARDCTPTAGRNPDANESIRPGTAAYDDVLDAVGRGALRDGRSALAVLHYETFGAPRTG
jgi:ADP-ribose pyrophosphatase